jgi:hypothetical protein
VDNLSVRKGKQMLNVETYNTKKLKAMDVIEWHHIEIQAALENTDNNATMSRA